MVTAFTANICSDCVMTCVEALAVSFYADLRCSWKPAIRVLRGQHV